MAMEFCSTFQALQPDTSNPVNAAIAVISAQLPPNELNYELTRLLLDSSGFRAQFSKDLVTKSDFKNILRYIEKNKPKSVTEILLRNSKYFRRCASFFEHIFYLDWNTFANEGNFDTYFSKLLDQLTMFNSEPLNEISFALQLKLVTAYLRRIRDGIEHDQNSKEKVFTFAKEVHKNTVFFKSANFQIVGNTELYEWIKLDDNLANDDYLRSIIWCIKLEKPTVVCHALSIAYSLLRMDRLQPNLILFAIKLVKDLEDLCFTNNRHIFDWICRCCEFIYKHHRERISRNFMADLLDNLYAEDRRRAKSVAGFWIHSVFDPKCHRTNIRIILRFLEGRATIHQKILVDSLIDDYPTIVNWPLIVEILLDEGDVPEETKFTNEEKEGLVNLMAFAIEEIVTGFPPEYRMSDMKQLDTSTRLSFSIKVTETLVPCFWRLFRIEYPRKEHAQVMLLNIIKYFHLPSISKDTLKDFVRACVSLFDEYSLPYSFQVIMDVLKFIMVDIRNEEVVELCNASYLELRNIYEQKLAELMNDFFNDPNQYTDLSSDRVRKAKVILTRVLCLNRNTNFPRRVAFAFPQQILARKIPPNNPVLLLILNVCVHLVSEYTYRATIDMWDFYEEKKKLPENHADILKDIDFAFKVLILKSVEWFRWPDIAAPTFLCVCKIAGAIKDWPLDQEPMNKIVTKDSKALIARFVANMVWKANDSLLEILNNGTRTFILEGFLNMIEWKILPTIMAYDPITYLKSTDSTYKCMEKPLRRFILGMCNVEEETTVAKWLSQWIISMFPVFPEKCPSIVSDFVDLIYPICKNMQNIIYLVVIKWIDFARSKSMRKGGSRPKSNIDFLPTVVKLCECLDQSKKADVEKYFKQISFQREDLTASKNFLKCLKKKSAPRKPEQAKSDAVSSPIMSSRRSSVAMFEENSSIWSPSPIPGSNSVLADESDLDSRSSSVMSCIVVRKDDDQNVPVAFSTPNKNLAAETQIADGLKAKTPSKSASSDDSVNILLGTLLGNYQIAESDDHTPVQSSSSVTPVEDTANIQKDPEIPSNSGMITSGEDSTDALFSIRPQELDIEEENTPQVLENVNDLLNIQSPTADEPTAAKSTSVTESSGDFPIEDVLNNVSMFSSPKEPNDQAENTSQAYGSVNELLKDLEFDELAVAKSPSVSDSSGRISDVVKNLQDVSLSNAETESGEWSSAAFDKSPLKKKRRSNN